MSSRKRVLFVSPHLPSPPSWGFGMRVYQLVRQVAASHDVTFLSYQHEDQSLDAGDLGRLCEDVQLVPRSYRSTQRRRGRQVLSLLGGAPFHSRELFTPRLQTAIDRCLDRGFDVVQVESSPMMCFRYAGSAALVLDEHNVESEILQRMRGGEKAAARKLFNGREADKYRRFETAAWRRADGVALTSHREVGELTARSGGTPVAVVPNGVDPDFFSPTTTPRGATEVVFNGLLTYRPNLDAVRFFLGEVLPRVHRTHPGVRFTVVGSGAESDLAQLRAQGAHVTGFVPDIRPYLAAAGCVVVPIRMGGGTRLKVVEALSAGAPMVSTSLGCEGIDVTPEEHLLVADDAAAMAAAVVRLLDDAALGTRLARAGRELAVDRYSWQRCAEPLLELYDRVGR